MQGLMSIPMVTEAVFGIPVSALTPAGLVAIFILLIAMGRLVPRRTMEDVIHDRNEWRAAHRISETARQQNEDTLRRLLTSVETLEAIIRAIPGAAAAAFPRDRDDDSGR